MTDWREALGLVWAYAADLFSTPEGATAVFTCVLALSTIGLWLSTRRLWRTRRTKPRQTSMSTWCFRLEFRMATAVSAGGQNAVQLRIGGIARPIELEPEITGTLEQADWFVCTSCGYASEQEARENGERLRAAFILAGARNYLGVDLGFGDYTFRFGQTISDEHRKSSGRELRGSIHGLDVFDRDKATVAVASKPRLRSPTRTEALQKNIQDAMNLCTNLSGRQEVCASLINDSFFVANQDVRFVMLVSAIEALCEQGPVTTSYHKLIEQLRRYLSGLEGVEREKNRVQSLLGENQKRVSVRQATRAKIETLLGPDKAEKFNEQFYGLRSDYLHDGTGRGEVGKHAHEVLQLAVELLEADIQATRHTVSGDPNLRPAPASAPQTTRFSEIVDAVVDELHPHQRPKKDVQELVRGLFELLLPEIAQLRRRLAGTPVAAKKHLTKVRETAAKLEILLLTMPNRIAWVGEMRPGLLGVEDETGLLVPAPIERPRQKIMDFVLDLERIQTEAKIAESYCGPSPLYEGDKHLSAKYARLLITALSKDPPTNAPSGPLRTIASLIFEVITGAKEANLERHCKALLRRSRPQPQMKRKPGRTLAF